MFKFVKARRDYEKCLSILASCDTFGQLSMAIKIVHNYGNVYGYSRKWSKLDSKAWGYWIEQSEKLRYKERLKEINEHETSFTPEGESDGVAPIA